MPLSHRLRVFLRAMDEAKLTAFFQPPLSLPSPLEKLEHPVFEAAALQVWVKREDLIHPYLSGNKWRKLKYNLLEVCREGHRRILTFGGAYSNHLYATAFAVQALGLEGIAVVRGERREPLNSTLAFAEQAGMKLVFVSRTAYRRRRDADFLAALRQKYGPFYLIPEGGTNSLALSGVEEVVPELLQQLPRQPDFLCLPCGTGGTLAGLVLGLAKAEKTHSKLIGFSALKGNFLTAEVRRLLDEHLPKGGKSPAWEIDDRWHFGGFARSKPELQAFLSDFKHHSSLPLEQVYTGKMLYGLIQRAKSRQFPPGSTLVVVHTGGLRA